MINDNSDSLHNASNGYVILLISTLCLIDKLLRFLYLFKTISKNDLLFIKKDSSEELPTSKYSVVYS